VIQTVALWLTLDGLRMIWELNSSNSCNASNR